MKKFKLMSLRANNESAMKEEDREISYRKSTSSKVSCYQNHGYKTCSNAFNIHEGRCSYVTGVCMDYNGFNTNCVNSASNFIGSDCYYAMLRFHCWNEID
jgi:hypothetical protein